MNENKLMMQFLSEELGTNDPKKIQNYLKGLDENKQKALATKYQQWKEAKKKKQATKAAHGSKLNYIKTLKHICPEGQELYYYKKGGNLECGCKGRKMEEGAKVEKAESGTVAKFKQGPGKLKKQPQQQTQNSKKLKIKQPQQQTVNPSDTVHVKGIAYSLTNMNGSRVDNRFPAYDGKVEKEDRAKAQAGDKDAKKRQEKAEMVTAPKKGTKLTTVEKFKSAKCGSKMKKHKQGGSLNGIPFYQGGTSEGGIVFPKRSISGKEAYMNDVAITDPQYQKYNNKANAYSNEAPTIRNIGSNILNRLKASYYGNKAALKAYYDKMDEYSRYQWNRGNYGEAIFGSPFVPIIRNYKPITESKPFNVVK